MNVDQIRADTPLTAKTIYLDTAAASIPPDCVLDTVRDYVLDTGHIGIYLPRFRKETYQRVEAVRSQVASLLNAKPAEIAFTQNGTVAISLIAQGIAWQTGDEVLVADTEMLSNLLPWQRLAETRGIVVKSVAANGEGLLSAEAFEQAITPRTRLITFSHLPNSTGAVQPAEAICAVARAHGVLSLVNSAQSLGMLQTDVQTLGCDFLTSCSRKALRGIEGAGVLYVREPLITQLEPCLTGWWNGAYDRESGQLALVANARRFEAGCPNVPALLGLGAAIEYAQAIGIDAIEARVRNLTTYAVRQLSLLPGFELYGPAATQYRISIVPFNIRGADPQQLVTALEAADCIIEAGHFMAGAILARYGVSSMARVSLHYFNTHAEIDRVAELIRKAIS
ncbi:aminotransferase class V-fold PLP-dependent enzyme [Andreprevotia chitinilytica]|uniref:aminotransferase class V-fold PLP-dependent enzyme n=1 Tax=Andreprevotia chitinilytica TaxID=396808 RepID=UPI000557970F|nr:aminotransferase class V-fold PLP-dependent enzyme [Andreprevotia chitinilytica]